MVARAQDLATSFRRFQLLKCVASPPFARRAIQARRRSLSAARFPPVAHCASNPTPATLAERENGLGLNLGVSSNVV